jgi:heterotetrameric sarcosine oxidase gamma subunit
VADSALWQSYTGRLFCLRARPQPWLDALAPGLALLPVARCLRDPRQGAVWMRLGPDEWWYWTHPGATEVLPGLVSEAAGAHHHALVEISDAHRALRLEGAACELLTQGCELDVARLPSGFAGRTRCAAFTVVVCPEGRGLWLWAEASWAESFERWLERAAAVQRGGAPCPSPPAGLPLKPSG